MKYSLSLAAVVGLASAAAVDITEAPSPLSVSLSPAGNSAVKAVITNTASKGYNLFYRGTILDQRIPANKLHVTQNGSEAEFKGVKLNYKTKNLKESSFIPLAAGESREVTIDMAEIYELSNSGIYDVLTEGHFRYAELGSTKLAGSVPFSSNKLSMQVDSHAASQVTKAIHLNAHKRSTVQSDCTSSQKSTVADSLARCAKQATAASQAALSGSASKFNEYFKTTDSASRKKVSDRFAAVAAECNNSPGGKLNVYCTDQYNYCEDDTFAYTVSSDNNVVWCNEYYASPMETTQCHGDDKTGTAIHEFTHASAVYSPATGDYAYGYTACSKLTSSKALQNADTHEYYANAIHLGVCAS